MASNARVVKLNPARLRVFVNRLPTCTRLLFTISVVFYIVGLIFSWFSGATALIPSQVSIWSAHRLNTYPFVHTGFIHLVLGLLALTPLLERIETDYGTLIALALFAGPFATIPGVAYIIVERFILRGDDAVQGVSVWVFLLLSREAVKTYRANPSFTLGSYAIPTYLYPLPLLIISHFLLPSSLTTDSIILNVCACAVGYGFEIGYLKFLIPPERALRFIETKLNLLGRIPHYVSVDHKTYGRYGVLPSASAGPTLSLNTSGDVRGVSPARYLSPGPALSSPPIGS